MALIERDWLLRNGYSPRTFAKCRTVTALCAVFFYRSKCCNLQSEIYNMKFQIALRPTPHASKVSLSSCSEACLQSAIGGRVSSQRRVFSLVCKGVSPMKCAFSAACHLGTWFLVLVFRYLGV